MSVSRKQIVYKNLVKACCRYSMVDGWRYDTSWHSEQRPVAWTSVTMTRRLSDAMTWRDVTPRFPTINHWPPAARSLPAGRLRSPLGRSWAALASMCCFPPVCSLMVARCLRHCNHCNNAIPDGWLACVCVCVCGRAVEQSTAYSISLANKARSQLTNDQPRWCSTKFV